MARYRGPSCRLCRREGEKLYLKGDRCYTDKCAFDRKSYPPGATGQARRGKLSEYGTQLREKQKVRRVYGMLEKQFRSTFAQAVKKKGVTSENFFKSLELRLDNVVFRMGYARSRNEARQLVRHNHIKINGKQANIPSMRVRIGDEIAISEKSKELGSLAAAAELYKRRIALPWFDVDHSKYVGKIISEPTREDIHMSVKDRLIVELYSK